MALDLTADRLPGTPWDANRPPVDARISLHQETPAPGDSGTRRLRHQETPAPGDSGTRRLRHQKTPASEDSGIRRLPEGSTKMAAQQPAAGMQPLRDGVGKVFIHFTMSLDGFIADAEGRVDWAFGFGRLSPQE